MRWALLFLLATACGNSDEVVIGSKNFTQQIQRKAKRALGFSSTGLALGAEAAEEQSNGHS